MIATSTFEQDKPYLWSKFQAPVFDPATGLDNETIKKNLLALAEELEDQPHPVVKARAFEYVARHVRIDVNPHDNELRQLALHSGGIAVHKAASAAMPQIAEIADEARVHGEAGKE